jgi:hypothetical protein
MSINTLERDAHYVRAPQCGVDMTSAVKRGLYDGTWSCIKLGFHSTSLRASEEPEPVRTTVDHAEIRGLATTLLVSVRRLPRI